MYKYLRPTDEEKYSPNYLHLKHFKDLAEFLPRSQQQTGRKCHYLLLIKPIL